jgi:hypothetical protein
VVPGRYVFCLRVTDEQGATDEDTVSVIIKHGKQYNGLSTSMKTIQLALEISDDNFIKIKLSTMDHCLM